YPRFFDNIGVQIEVRELRDTEEFYDILKVQEAVGFAPGVGTVAPHLFKAVAMKEPPMGMVLGAYGGGEMIGYLYEFPTSLQEEHYMHGVHVIPKCQGLGVGERMMLRMREIALERGINVVYWTYDPLEGKNASLYIRKCGARGVRYYKAYYKDVQGGFSDAVSNDRFLAKWELKTIGGQKPEGVLDKIPIVEGGSAPQGKEVLVEIPTDFTSLMGRDIGGARGWRMKTSKLFDRYVTKSGYNAVNFLQFRGRNFYLLAKP
ncbi:MAG: GNAT family N-acetyltransferase, partial [Candidatus Altiarchaeota archaeon]|nr:GNAT family N-acetyltransferase [Candidatus Altiarchaeota archaeon]